MTTRPELQASRLRSAASLMIAAICLTTERYGWGRCQRIDNARYLRHFALPFDDEFRLAALEIGRRMAGATFLGR